MIIMNVLRPEIMRVYCLHYMPNKVSVKHFFLNENLITTMKYQSSIMNRLNEFH